MTKDGNTIVTRNGNPVIGQNEIWKLRGENPKKALNAGINNASYTYEIELPESDKSPEKTTLVLPKPTDDKKK